MMNKISDIELKKYTFLKKFTIKRTLQDNGGLQTFVSIVMAEESSPKSHLLNIQCFDVLDLRIKELNSQYQYWLEITDIASWHRENQRYYVTDTEEEIFKLYCRDIKIYKIKYKDSK